MTKKNEEMILCDECKGEGIIHKKECVGYHNNDYEYWDELCPECEGSGRLNKITTIKYTPYKAIKPKSR